jgi:glutaminyl-peptide cyclotransferase
MRVLSLVMALLLGLGSVSARADTPWSLVKAYPHDAKAFTEGLLFLDGYLYESTGKWGESTLRKVRLKDGKVLKRAPIEKRYFGEGIVNWGKELISLTWVDGIGFRWNRDTLRRTGSFRYAGEGWALTQDGARIIMSDGTPVLRFLDPQTLTQIGSLTVTWQGRPVALLNELEYVRGEIWANIFMASRIARIDPVSGAVIDWIDLSALKAEQANPDPDAVLNGIAYDAKADRIFVTGKYWKKLYEISVPR